MGTKIRITLPMQRVLGVFLEDSSKTVYGLELARAAGLPSGTIYPILARLEGAGWVASAWEDIDESREGRRRRRYYHLTALGKRCAKAELEEVRRLLFPTLAQEPIGGGQPP